jgi:hypothetical protein
MEPGISPGGLHIHTMEIATNDGRVKTVPADSVSSELMDAVNTARAARRILPVNIRH